MTDKNLKYVPFVTEVMTARYPKLTEPDTKGEYADGKYKTEATADDDYTERFQEEIGAVIDAHFAGKKNVHTPWKETKEGAIAFNFKSPKKKPELFDAKGNPLKPGIVIHGGSLIRISGLIAAWQKGQKRGVSLWPDAVRVIKLAVGFDASEPFCGAGGDFDASQAFGPPEDGYDGSAPA
ncbi:hypothetical protein [Bradyrhizobium sp. LB5.2]|uniref:hypothetical protein n=1 Tax=Bradyrhizobium sp. LB5.2 TaxID=3156329 RepID=UPI003390F534